MKQNQDLFCGELVRLAADESQLLAEKYAAWGNDSEYQRLLDSFPANLYSVKKRKEWVEKNFGEPNDNSFFFTIHALDDDRLLGEVELDGICWNQGDSLVGIGLGEREAWGKGYGTDAMRLILRFAFCELNLRRVTLNVFEYNPRAIRSYEKVGFKVEGRVKRWLHREGRRWDLIYMGILREEWEARYANT